MFIVLIYTTTTVLFCELWVHNKNILTFYSVTSWFLLHHAIQWLWQKMSAHDQRYNFVICVPTWYLIFVSQLKVQKTLNLWMKMKLPNPSIIPNSIYLWESKHITWNILNFECLKIDKIGFSTLYPDTTIQLAISIRITAYKLKYSKLLSFSWNVDYGLLNVEPLKAKRLWMFKNGNVRPISP